MLGECAFLPLVPPIERTLKHNRDSRVFVEKERKRMRRKEKKEGMMRAHLSRAASSHLPLLLNLCAFSKGMQPETASSR